MSGDGAIHAAIARLTHGADLGEGGRKSGSGECDLDDLDLCRGLVGTARSDNSMWTLTHLAN